MRIQAAKENNVATQAIIRDEDRDLGFGSVVAETRNIRLLNRDGSFNVTRKGLGYWESLSLYRSMLTMGWTKFFSLLLVGYLVVNLLFAGAYIACGPNAYQRAAAAISAKLALRPAAMLMPTTSQISPRRANNGAPLVPRVPAQSWVKNAPPSGDLTVPIAWQSVSATSSCARSWL